MTEPKILAGNVIRISDHAAGYEAIALAAIEARDREWREFIERECRDEADWIERMDGFGNPQVFGLTRAGAVRKVSARILFGDSSGGHPNSDTL